MNTTNRSDGRSLTDARRHREAAGESRSPGCCCRPCQKSWEDRNKRLYDDPNDYNHTYFQGRDPGPLNNGLLAGPLGDVSGLHSRQWAASPALASILNTRHHGNGGPAVSRTPADLNDDIEWMLYVRAHALNRNGANGRRDGFDRDRQNKMEFERFYHQPGDFPSRTNLSQPDNVISTGTCADMKPQQSQGHGKGQSKGRRIASFHFGYEDLFPENDRSYQHDSSLGYQGPGPYGSNHGTSHVNQENHRGRGGAGILHI